MEVSMKKEFIRMSTFLFLTVFLTFFIYPDSSVRLLRIEKSPLFDKGKPDLHILIEDLKNMIDEPGLNSLKEELHVRIYSPLGKKILKLGRLKKGKVKWFFKKVNKKYLRVKMDPNDAQVLWQEVISKKRKTKYCLALTSNPQDSKYLKVVKQFKLSFFPHLDLNAVVTYPIAAAPGSQLRNLVSLTIYNEGLIPAENFFVETVLSGDGEIPMKPAVYSKHFREDVLFKGGRLLIELLKPGHSVTLTFDGAMTIPKDTPEGRYNLGVVLDPENRIDELKETNNCLSRLIIITKNPAKVLSSINQKPVVIPRKKRSD
jgi:hypothetical protein